MKKSKKKLIVTFCIFQIISPVFAMSSFTDNEIIWQASSNENIKYIGQDTTNFGENDHPVVLQAIKISSTLKSINFYQQEEAKSLKEKKFKSVFTAQQADLLGRHLEEGLKNAKSNQDIIFVMEKSVKRLTFLKPARYFVAGRVFYKDKRLNIIIGDYDRLRNEIFEAANDPTGTGHIHYSFNYGKRLKPSRFKKAIININGIENKQQNDTRRADWLVIDVNVTSQAIKHMAKVRKKDEIANQRNALMEVIGSEDTIDIDTVNDPEKITHSVEQRLTELKHLRSKDLITDEEYTQKRKQILDDL